MPNEQIMYVLNKMIKEWAQTKKAFISLSTYTYEIDEWRKLTGVHRVKRMLEIGSGSGWFLTTAVALGFAEEGVGVDPAIPEDGTSIDEVQATKSAIKRLGLDERIHFYICTFEEFLREALSKGEKYDLLAFRNTLHHLYPRLKQNPTEYVDKCVKDLHCAFSLLNDPGYLYVLEMTRPSKLYAAAYNLYRTLRGAPNIDWDSKRTLSEWRSILREGGFEWIGVTRLPVHHPLLLNIPGGHTLAKILSRQFLAAAHAVRT